MKISKTHQNFAVILYDQRALSHPDEFLGPNWKDVLNFWFFIDTLSPEQFEIAWGRYRNLDPAYCDSAWLLAENAASKTIDVFNVPGAFSATQYHVFGYATCEVIGSHNLLENGNSLVFTDLIISPEWT
jgi:hypothetical protein